ncbi:hypothetical protein G6F62_014489 [Rhizopus arrhizus]|nr:hypothetical protein G6F62_014489 [Rhizopus arrhizus]
MHVFVSRYHLYFKSYKALKLRDENIGTIFPPTVPPELEEDVPITAILDELPMQYASTTTTILCGDFNARLGQITGDTRLDSRGRAFSNWIQTQNLTLWNQHLCFAKY